MILNWLLNGYTAAELAGRGFDAARSGTRAQATRRHALEAKLPTVAMISGAAIGESYLRPVDY